MKQPRWVQAMAAAANGAISIVPALEQRDGPSWPQVALDHLAGVTFNGTLPQPELWASFDVPQRFWPV